jgi:hypothetical protein
MRTLLLCVALAAASCASAPPTTPPASPADTNPRTDDSLPLHVDDAVVQIATSYPAQVTVQVKGSMPDPCSSVGTVTQRREGNKVIVNIPVRRGSGICAQMIQSTAVSVRLDGGFESGNYVVVINGVERPFKI